MHKIFIGVNKQLDKIYPQDHSDFMEQNMPNFKEELHFQFEDIHQKIFQEISENKFSIKDYARKLEEWFWNIEKSIRLKNVSIMFDGEIIE